MVKTDIDKKLDNLRKKINSELISLRKENLQRVLRHFTDIGKNIVDSQRDIDAFISYAESKRRWIKENRNKARLEVIDAERDALITEAIALYRSLIIRFKSQRELWYILQDELMRLEKSAKAEEKVYQE